MNERLRRTGTAAALAVLAFAVYLASPIVTSFDSRWSIYSAWSLIREGDLDLDEYADVLERERHEATVLVGDQRYDFFPPGAAVAAVPFVALFTRAPIFFEYLTGRELGPERRAELAREPYRFKRGIEKIAASAITAAAAGVLALAAAARAGIPAGIAAGAVFAFATPAWSTASRGLWQHGPSMLLLSLALLAALTREMSARRAVLLGALLGAAYIVRPTNSVPALVFGAGLALTRPRLLLWYGAALGAVLAPFAAWSASVYGTLLPPYYLPGRIEGHAAYGEALLANLFSPSRGLFVFSPVLVCGVLAVIARIRAGTVSLLDALLLSAAVLHLVLVSSFPKWWAGHSYGPRFMADMAPFLVFLLVPALEKMRFRPVAVAILALTLVSGWMHQRGAFSWAVWRWNVKPADVDAAPERVWSWRDPQFLR